MVMFTIKPLPIISESYLEHSHFLKLRESGPE